MATIATLSFPLGASYSTVSPGPFPSSALPRGLVGESTPSTPSCRSSSDPTKYFSVVVVSVVAQLHYGANGHGTVIRRLDNYGVAQNGGQTPYAGLHHPLLVLGRLVVAVLGQVAQLARDLDLAGDIDAAPRSEVLQLRLEAVEGISGQLGRLSHGARCYRAPSACGRLFVTSAQPGCGFDRSIGPERDLPAMSSDPPAALPADTAIAIR